MEDHQKEWLERAKKFSNRKFAEEQVKNELYDFTWWSTKDIILQNIRILDGTKLFEMGFGWGRVIHMLKTEFPDLAIAGIELTKELYERALDLVEKNKFSGVSLFLGDILEFPWKHYESAYEAIISIRVLHYISDKRKAIRIIHAMLKEKGVVFISIPNKFCPLRWVTYHHPLYSIFKLKNDLEAEGFKNIRIGFYNFCLPFMRSRGNSGFCRFIEKMLRKFPILSFMGGLSFVVAEK